MTTLPLPFPPVGLFGPIGTWEILLILLVLLLLFGAKKLPELAKGMGRSIKEFKKATQEVEDDIRTSMEDKPADQKSDTSAPKKKAEEEKQHSTGS